MNLALIDFFSHLNPISWMIVCILLTLSILSWYIIIRKILEFSWLYWQARRFKHTFWNEAPWITQAHQHSPRHPFIHLAIQSIQAANHHTQHFLTDSEHRCHYDEFITRAIRQVIQISVVQLESGLSTLATIGNTAPFIGLLGTVLSIHSALIAIGVRGNASLDTVATSIGEALIMTAIGLAVAIPAVLAYNGLIRSTRQYILQLETFAHELFTLLTTGKRLNTFE